MTQAPRAPAKKDQPMRMAPTCGRGQGVGVGGGGGGEGWGGGDSRLGSRSARGEQWWVLKMLRVAAQACGAACGLGWGAQNLELKSRSRISHPAARRWTAGAQPPDRQRQLCTGPPTPHPSRLTHPHTHLAPRGDELLLVELDGAGHPAAAHPGIDHGKPGKCSQQDAGQRPDERLVP